MSMPQSSHRYDLLLGRTGQQSAPSMAASGARPEAANFNMGFRSAPEADLSAGLESEAIGNFS
jgi:hypothetical protein